MTDTESSAKISSFVLKKTRSGALTAREVSYLRGKQLQTGSTATVVRALRWDTEVEKSFVALKIFNMEVACDRLESKLIENEVNVLSKVDHPNVIKLQRVLVNNDSVTRRNFCYGIELEYCSIGDLTTFLPTSTGYNLSEKFIRSVFQQLVRAVSYLHNNNIVHGDIKCENILIKNNGTVVLADFGVAQQVQRVEKRRPSLETIPEEYDEEAVGYMITSNGIEPIPKSLLPPREKFRQIALLRESRINLRYKAVGGTLQYKAPEQFPVEKKPVVDGAAGDIWALGILLHVMMQARFPSEKEIMRIAFSDEPSFLFNNRYRKKAKKLTWAQILFGNGEEENRKPKKYSSDCIELLRECLVIEPEFRMNTAELEVHPFVKAFGMRGSYKTVRKEIKRLNLREVF